MTRKMNLSALLCAAAFLTALPAGAEDAAVPLVQPGTPIGKNERNDSPIDKAKVMATAGASAKDQLPAAPKSGEMTFVFSDFSHALYPGWETCPKGWALTNEEQYLASLPKAEVTRLLKPENEPERNAKWKADSAPSGKNVCTNYKEFPNRPLQLTVANKVAYGLDLHDGAGEGYTCAHETFDSPTGETGVDNQHYRALGCTRTYRGPDGGDGEIVQAYKGHIATGQYTVVMLLRGVDSLVNDDKVEVILASSDEQPIIDTSQNVLAGASFHVTANPKWRHELRGRIVDGVLMTESKDLVIKKGSASGSTAWDLERAKLKVAFRADGSVQGLIGGYEPMYEPIRNQTRGGQGSAHTGGLDCASKWNTIQVMADGGRDPKTGKCTRLSSAYKISAVPAFVFDRPPESPKTAMTN